jgi:hypothetical protein
MKITIESTSQVVFVDGVETRVWEGHTESVTGVRVAVTAFVARIVAADVTSDVGEAYAKHQRHAGSFDAACEWCLAVERSGSDVTSDAH